ncbi:hypothetical protein JCGZ_26004 [Jatropha curcas]|uniref:BHLH domain-containing protein n=1 Tax=Jatropha curcas TaxID=180498 RepID=A0A067JH95_JATCU|nr:hypothetical protein JCGZ_26004 [Jatropha curcas]
MSDSLSDFLDEHEFGDTTLDGDDLFAIFESLDSVAEFPPVTPSDEVAVSSKENDETTRLVSQKSTSSSALVESETEQETSPKNKRQKTTASSEEAINTDGQQRKSHITVERNRRKQMNEHLSVLRSLMPCFYVKRGDQASIIGGVVDYINELQQILQSLEAKKQRKVYSEVLSPRIVSSPRPSPLSPRKPPLSPRLNLPISPRTPQPGSPYRPRLQQAAGYLSPTMASASLEPSPTSSSSSINDNINELVANSKSAIADVEIGIECQLSAEELAQQIQQTFC